MIQLSSELFRAAFAHSAACKLVYAPDGRLIYISPGLYRLLNYLPPTLDEQLFTSLMHPADLEREYTQLSQVLAGKTAGAIEKRLKNSQGEWVWVQQQLTAILEPGSKTANLQCLIADIKDIRSRKRIEAAHDSERARLLVVEDLAQIGSWQINAETGQFWLSDTCYRLLGYLPGQLEPGALMRLSFIHPQDRKAVRQRLSWIFATGLETVEASPDWLDDQGDISADFRLLRPDGEIRYVTSKIRPDYSQGRLLSLTGFLLDVTAFYLKEQLLQDANQLLQRQHQHLRDLGQRLMTSLKQPLREATQLFGPLLEEET